MLRPRRSVKGWKLFIVAHKNISSLSATQVLSKFLLMRIVFFVPNFHSTYLITAQEYEIWL